MERFIGIHKVLFSIEKKLTEALLEGSYFKQPIFLVSVRTEVKSELKGWNFGEDGALHIVEDLASIHEDSGVVFFDLDSSEDIESAIRDLIGFRNQKPIFKVVIFSTKFNKDDTGLERIMIADASMCWPFREERLKSLWPYIVENNDAWQSKFFNP